MLERINKITAKVGLILILVVLVWVAMAYLLTDIFSRPLSLGLVVLAAIALIAAVLLQMKKKFGLAFSANALVIVFVTIAVFAGMFARVLISTLDPAWSLTIYNASSTPYTLKIMSIIALTLVPLVLLYQGWNYWIFRKRITSDDVEY